MNNKYVGNRYVPKIYGEWTNTVSYEPLLIVTYQGNSYTSKTFVPVGIDINNTNFWVCTGNYNVQLEYYRQNVINYNKNIEEFRRQITTENNELKDDLQIQIDDTLKLAKTKVDNIVYNQATNTLDFYSGNTVTNSITITQSVSNENIQSYIDSLVTQGRISGVSLGQASVTKRELSPSVFLDDNITFTNINMNSTTNNTLTKYFYFTSGNLSNTTISLKGLVNENMTQQNYCPQLVLGIYKCNSLAEMGTNLKAEVVSIVKGNETIDFTYSGLDFSANQYVVFSLAVFSHSFTGLFDFQLLDFNVKINGAIRDVVQVTSKASDVATYGFSYELSGKESVAKKSDIAVLPELVTEINNVKANLNYTAITVSTAQELVDALTEASTKATSDMWYNIYLKDGTYDLLPFINLASITAVTATGYRGIEVPRWTRLIGTSYLGAKITVSLDNNTTTTEQQWTVSPLNLKNDAELENLYVYGKNCRYAVHDDGANTSFKRHVKNCVFEHGRNESNVVWAQQEAYGMGTYHGSSIVFENTTFIGYGHGLYIHDNPNFTLDSSITIKNCTFKGGDQFTNESLRFESMGATGITSIDITKSLFNKPINKKIDDTNRDSMTITGYSNGLLPSTLGIDIV
jgi:hypothetical protein